MNKNIQVIVYVVIGFVIGYFVGKIDLSSVSNVLPKTCTYMGKTYKEGEGFKDDCNTCTCQSGEVICTLIACEGRK